MILPTLGVQVLGTGTTRESTQLVGNAQEGAVLTLFSSM